MSMKEKVSKTERRLSLSRLMACAALSFLTVILIGLGIWQVERRSWRLALIARVDARARAEAIPLPAQAQWKMVSVEDDEYLRVTMSGRLENDRESLVFASTALGPGYWVITPLRFADNTAIMVNRGFVPLNKRSATARRAGQIATQADAAVSTAHRFDKAGIGEWFENLEEELLRDTVRLGNLRNMAQPSIVCGAIHQNANCIVCLFRKPHERPPHHRIVARYTSFTLSQQSSEVKRDFRIGASDRKIYKLKQILMVLG